LKKHNLATSRSFRSPKSKIKRRWRRIAPALGDFWKFVTKIMHFRHISTSVVASPLSYKTKTKIIYFCQDQGQDRSGQDRSGQDQDQDHFFKTKTKIAFLKTIKLLTQDHWRSQKFWLEGAKIRKIFVT